MFHEFNLENTSVRQLGKGFKPFLGPSDSLFSSSLKQARTKREEQEQRRQGGGCFNRSQQGQWATAGSDSPDPLPQAEGGAVSGGRFGELQIHRTDRPRPGRRDA